MTYTVKEIFYTLQGEGAQRGHAGRVLPLRRLQSVDGSRGGPRDGGLPFCDTDFVGTDGPGGGKFASADELAAAVAAAWPAARARASGSWSAPAANPLLQLDAALVAALHARGFGVAVETNGTQPLQPRPSTGSASAPRRRHRLVVRAGDELKLVYPQAEPRPSASSRLDFAHFFLQPMDGPSASATRGSRSSTASSIRTGG